MISKSDMRHAAKEIRARASQAAPVETGYRLAGHFVAGPLVAWDFERRPVIAGYWPFRTEMDVKPLLAMLVAYGFVVALPVGAPAEPELSFRQWQPDMTLERDGLGMQCPPNSAPFVDPDIVIAPALAFDARGYRLGYGKGYYDATLRLFRSVRPMITVVAGYGAQEVPEVPAEAQDERVDWIVTETGARKAVA